MELEFLAERLESAEFAAEMNLAPSERVFRKRLEGHDAFRQLIELLSSRTTHVALLSRLQTLVNRRVDPRFEHPLDAAFAVYLIALDQTAGPEFAVEAALSIAKIPNCWWAVKVWQELIPRAYATGKLESVPARTSPSPMRSVNYGATAPIAAPPSELQRLGSSALGSGERRTIAPAERLGESTNTNASSLQELASGFPRGRITRTFIGQSRPHPLKKQVTRFSHSAAKRRYSVGGIR